MGSFLVINEMGFFPVAAQDFYLIGSTTFPRSSIILANGKTFSVVAENSSPANVYIAKAMWNGKLYQRSWLTHDQLMAGGEPRPPTTDKPPHPDTRPRPPPMADKTRESVHPRTRPD